MGANPYLGPYQLGFVEANTSAGLGRVSAPPRARQIIGQPVAAANQGGEGE